MRARSLVAVLATSGLCGTFGIHPAVAGERTLRVQSRLPWPVFVGTSQGRFSIRPSGAVVRLSRHPWRSPRPRIPRGWLGPPHGPFGHIEDGHVVVTQGRKTIWQSERTFDLGDHAKLWDFTVWNFGLTFQVRRHGPLFASWSGCTERRVDRGVFAEGITHSGRLITLRRKTRSFQSWDSAARRPKTLARGLSIRALDASYFDERTGTFLYWTRHGALVRTDGVRRTPLAHYRTLGFRYQPQMSVFDYGLMELLSRTWREVILRPDGSVFARVKVPSDGSVAGFGYQVADRMGDAVAYVLTPTGRPRHSTVFLLRAGATHGQVLYSGSGDSPCAIAVGWHDRWLLFAPVGGRGLLIDTTGQSPPIDLTAVIHGLPGHARMVRWAYRLRGPGPIHAAAATA